MAPAGIVLLASEDRSRGHVLAALIAGRALESPNRAIGTATSPATASHANLNTLQVYTAIVDARKEKAYRRYRDFLWSGLTPDGQDEG